MNDPSADAVNGWNESQMMVRFVPNLARRVKEWADVNIRGEIDTHVPKDPNPPFSIRWTSEREAEITFLGGVYPGVVVDQPCVIESWKKVSASKYYKTGDVAQLLLVTDPQDPESVAWVEKNCKFDMAAWKLKSGITPPTKHIWPRVFRSQAKKHPTGFAKVEDDLDDMMQFSGKEGDVEVDFVHPQELSRMYMNAGQVLKLNGEPIPSRLGVSIQDLIRERAEAVSEANKRSAAPATEGQPENPPPILSPAPQPVQKRPKH